MDYRLEDVALNILLSFDEETQQWLSHCLELDLMEQGDTPLEALKTLFKNVQAYLVECAKSGMDCVFTAPPEDWRNYFSARPVSLDALHTTTVFPPNIIVRSTRNLHVA